MTKNKKTAKKTVIELEPYARFESVVESIGEAMRQVGHSTSLVSATDMFVTWRGGHLPTLTVNYKVSPPHVIKNKKVDR